MLQCTLYSDPLCIYAELSLFNLVHDRLDLGDLQLRQIHAPPQQPFPVLVPQPRHAKKVR